MLVNHNHKTRAAVYYFSINTIRDRWDEMKEYVKEYHAGEVKSAEDLIDYIEREGNATAVDALGSPIFITENALAGMQGVQECRIMSFGRKTIT